MGRNGMMVLALVGVLAFVACEDDDEDSNRFRASLTGGAERPTPVTTTATGTFTLVDNGSNMSFTLNVNGLPQVATGAHIHVAPTRAGSTTLPLAADTSGPVIVNLSPSATVQTGLLASGNFTVGTSAAITLDSVRALLRNGRAYVNVHTAANPGGHIRGAIVRDD